MGDPYLYPGTEVLRNNLGFRDKHLLEAAELEFGQFGLVLWQAKGSRLPIGVLRLKAIRKAIFGEIYDWAGEFRQNIGSMQKYRPAGYPVVYPPAMYIPQEMDRIFG